MTITIQDRPIEKYREEVIDQLVMNYGHDRLSLEAFQRRLDQAFDAQEHDTLSELVTDLDLVIDESYVDQKKEEFSIGIDQGESQDVEYMVNIFSGSNRGGTWNVAKEIRMLNIFGGGDIDLTDARFCHPEIHVRMLCIFGGVTIFVPKEVNVVSNALCLFGGLENKAQTNAGSGSPKVVVEGLVLFSGVSIKIKKVLKERFVEFADGLKNMFAQTQRNK